ncbi:hypothetical protein CPCC7001_599 [Cyanobium sp. PCC 7001]|uniref:hypothetical protein n=1 Tax=Cyanobium sp. PCC 7001 TaxID=180281 RepID=UPI000180559A|nr:hypothetical protein [Cyanobium sp. PCC 7001]EDY37720.1 hypothetical protein CPCC7001_599 [Cyanobium sp. PCC 7001]
MPQPSRSPLQPPARSVPAAPALGVVLVGLALAVPSAASAAPLPAQPADMERTCQEEAASTFKVRSRDIRTLPVERRPGRGYVMYGQTSPRDGSARFFVCSFDNGRRLTGVSPTSDQRASGTGRSRSMAPSAMPGFCRRMVAEEFQLNPRAISVEEAQKQRNDSYTVRAIARPVSGKTLQAFECRFGSKGRYKRVERLD